MNKYDVIVIGGGPSGIITASTAKKLNPDKKILIIKEEEKGLVPCGIPYIFHDLGDIKKNEMSHKPFENIGGEVLIDRVSRIDTDKKIVETESCKSMEYEKLVFATGSKPLVPSFIKGYDLDGVFYINKSYSKMEQVAARAAAAENIVVVGGGFIGVEVAEQLAKAGDKKITLVEVEEYCLSRAFSPDVCKQADEKIRNAGVDLLTKTKVEELPGADGKVENVVLSSGEKIKTDMVIFTMGYKPNTELAAASGLKLNNNGSIIVDNYLRTGVKNIYAVGDCSSTSGFITGRTDNIMLASTATAEARVLGYNLFDIKLKRNFAGTLAVFSTEINGKTFASCGAIEQQAREASIEYIIGEFTDADRHPGTFADTQPLFVKLIVSPGDGSIIGCEITGGKSAGEMINIASLAIQKNVTVFELISFQVGTHPLLTGAPTKYALIKAAEIAADKIFKGRSN